MIQWLRSHLTFASVVSLAALFVALGGTATAVTYVVSSNSQVGPGTISGHKPPSGDHSNIIPGSLNGTDLANNAVTASKLGAVAKFAKRTATASSTKVLSLGGLTVHYQCKFNGTTLEYEPTLTATTTVNQASITLGFISGSQGFSNSYFAADDAFQKGELFDLSQGGQDFAEGTAVYSTPGGSVVNLNFGFDSQAQKCLAHGLAMVR
jgi:hypothetical protein